MIINQVKYVVRTEARHLAYSEENGQVITKRVNFCYLCPHIYWQNGVPFVPELVVKENQNRYCPACGRCYGL